MTLRSAAAGVRLIAEQFAGVAEEDKFKMISGNAARLYGIE